MSGACLGCGAPLAARRSSARWCSERCRSRARRRPPPPSAPQRCGEVAAAVEAELVAAGQRHSVAGECAVSIARRLDHCTEGGSVVAALSRELRACLDAALAGGSRGADPLDEIKKARERRQRRDRDGA